MALLTLAAVFACKINTDLDQPVAIDIVLPDSGRVEVTDTFRPRARALNGIGDSVQAELSWASLDTAVLAVLDSTTGVSISKTIGSARLQARTGNLFSNPQTVTVLARLDSIRVLGAARATVFAADSLSDSLQVQAFALGGAIPANRRVVFTKTTFPASDSMVTLVPKDTVFTNPSTGVAVVQVRLGTGPVPDSVVVTATMQHVNRTPVQGSPLTFVVEFRP
ncbi:MAG: hypothetical protein DMD64_13550 [Gemmatimonadetes bacterium]|nr:MAG: hypothetical protein DMD64_13550 [Gemmatimonadota bacterium]